MITTNLTDLFQSLTVSVKYSSYLAGARRHLEETVSFGVDRPLELTHVGELLRVDEVVGELHQEARHVQLHRGAVSFSCNVNVIFAFSLP